MTRLKVLCMRVSSSPSKKMLGEVVERGGLERRSRVTRDILEVNIVPPNLAWQPVLECSHGLHRGSWEPPDNWPRVNIGLPGQRLNLGRSGRSAGMSQFVEALPGFL